MAGDLLFCPPPACGGREVGGHDRRCQLASTRALDFRGVPRHGIDLTACWRPRVGMVTHAVALAQSLLQLADARSLVLFSSRERVAGLEGEYEAVLSPHRHELANKLLWLPPVEAAAVLDAILYPYWPPPPRRRLDAPPAGLLVLDLAFRLCPAEVLWTLRADVGIVLPR